MRGLLYIIAIILIIGWLLGFFVFSLGHLIHILLITINRQKLNFCRFYFYVIQIQLFTSWFSVFLKPTAPLKEGPLYGCRALVTASPALDVGTPAFGYYPHQVQMAYQVYPNECRYSRKCFFAFR